MGFYCVALKLSIKNNFQISGHMLEHVSVDAGVSEVMFYV
jgi:hypothetical protein